MNGISRRTIAPCLAAAATLLAWPGANAQYRSSAPAEQRAITPESRAERPARPPAASGQLGTRGGARMGGEISGGWGSETGDYPHQSFQRRRMGIPPPPPSGAPEEDQERASRQSQGAGSDKGIQRGGQSATRERARQPANRTQTGPRRYGPRYGSGSRSGSPERRAAPGSRAQQTNPWRRSGDYQRPPRDSAAQRRPVQGRDQRYDDRPQSGWSRSRGNRPQTGAGGTRRQPRTQGSGSAYRPPAPNRQPERR